MELAQEMDESDLARRILDASLALIDESGLASLSMREVARRAGVSHQAPYHHFADRETILAAIARDGFEILHLEMGVAIAAAVGINARLLAGAETYVKFALAHPAHFRVMFRPDLVDIQRFPDAKCSGDIAFGHVRGLVHELLGTTEEAATPEDDVWTSLLWSSSHGLACLLLDGPLAVKIPSSRARDGHIRDVLQTLTGLVAPPSPARKGASEGAASTAPLPMAKASKASKPQAARVESPRGRAAPRARRRG